jgi:hypothetical protein
MRFFTTTILLTMLVGFAASNPLEKRCSTGSCQSPSECCPGLSCQLGYLGKRETGVSLFFVVQVESVLNCSGFVACSNACLRGLVIGGRSVLCQEDVMSGQQWARICSEIFNLIL